MIYLASPYWHDDSNIRRARAEAAACFAAEMVKQGEVVFSPVAHGCYIEQALTEEIAVEIWVKHGLAMVQFAEQMIVLMLDGYEDSRGVQGEVCEAERLDIPIAWTNGVDG